MDRRLKNRLLDVGMAIVAVMAGALVVYLGDMALGVNLELYYGVATFSPLWVLDLFLVPFIAGILVSYIYGLGGKILAHLSPLVVRVASFYGLSNGGVVPPGTDVLPMSFWLLVVIISVEFAAFGGVVGEILVKKTYGRTAKELLHKKYQLAEEDELPSVADDAVHKPGTVEK